MQVSYDLRSIREDIHTRTKTFLFDHVVADE